MKRTRPGLRLSFAAALLGVGAISFGQTPPHEDYAAAQRAYESAQAKEARIAQIEQDRAGFVAALLDPWRGGFADGGEEMERFLLTAPVERLLAATSARDLDAFRSAVTGGKVAPNVLGEVDSDLVFFPVAPCRIFDTRFSAAGILVAGVVQSFFVNGNMSTQGGDAGGCGIPVDPSAVVFNLAGVTPTGAGNIRAWRFNDPVPTAVVLNFNTGNTNPALSNMVTVPTCDLCGADISLRADVSNVHAVGDIVGYYDLPTGLPLSAQATIGTQVAVGASSTEIVGLDFTCPADGFVIATGHVVADLNHSTGTTDNMYLKINNAADTTFFGPGWTQTVLQSALPSAPSNRIPVYLGARFSCTAGVSTRYRINAQMVQGQDASDQAGWGALILEYSPY